MELTREEREKAIDQIRKIKRKADGTSHEAEAETFLKKVADMLAKFGLTEADLREKDIQRLFGKTIYDLKYSDDWRRALINSVGKFCGVYPVWIKSTSKFELHGRDFNIDATIETYIWVHDQIRQVARSMYPGDTKSYRQAQKGLSLGTCLRIQDILKTYVPDGKTDTSVPMIVEFDLVRDNVLNTDKNIRQSKYRAMNLTSAGVNGFNSADRINLRPLMDKQATSRGAIAK